MLGPGVPFLNGSAKYNKPPRGINVISSHQALVFKSCIRLTINEKIDGINMKTLTHIKIVKSIMILIDNLCIK